MWNVDEWLGWLDDQGFSTDGIRAHLARISEDQATLLKRWETANEVSQEMLLMARRLETAHRHTLVSWAARLAPPDEPQEAAPEETPV